MRNEADWIERCLGSVLAQDYPADRMEVIVADGESDDRSLDILRGISERDPRVRVINNPGRIVPTGLNEAIAAARGDIICRVDAHTVLEPDYVHEGVELIGRTGIDRLGISGPMVCRGGGPVADAVAVAMHSRFGIGAAFHFATEEVECDTLYMGMWPRANFEQVGLYDPELVRNQDDELSYRIRKNGGRIIVTPAMRSLYQNRESWRTLARQFYQYGVWKVRVLQKHPLQMSIRHFIPPAFQVALVLAALGAPLCAWSAWLALAAASGYLVATLVAALLETPGGWAQRLRVWRAFTIIHHCWAFGFLVGSAKFAGRWLGREEEPPRLAVRAAVAE